MTIVEFIKQEMAARGMTYEQLAEHSGMSRQNLWDKLNKRVQPNFGNVRKILAGMDCKIVVEKRSAEVTVEEGLEKFFDIAESEQVSYECIKGLLYVMGYDVEIKTHKNEENVKKGIDN